MKRSRASTGSKSVANVLAAVVARHRLGTGLKRAQALAVWGELVGAQLARTTRAVALREGVMIIETQDAVAANFLSMQKPMFLEMLRHRLGTNAPEDLRFQMGMIDEREAKRPNEPVIEVPPGTLDAPLAPPVEKANPVIADTVRRAAEAITRARAQRKALGWTRCEICDTLTPTSGLCAPCRILLRDPAVEATSAQLVRDPRLILSPERLGTDEFAIHAARKLALEYLEARMDELVLLAVQTTTAQIPQSGEHPANAEARLYLELTARSYLALKHRMGLDDVQLTQQRSSLPERVAHFIETIKDER